MYFGIFRDIIAVKNIMGGIRSFVLLLGRRVPLLNICLFTRHVNKGQCIITLLYTRPKKGVQDATASTGTGTVDDSERKKSITSMTCRGKGGMTIYGQNAYIQVVVCTIATGLQKHLFH